MRLQLAAFIALNLLDVVTTVIGLRFGNHEGNPFFFGFHVSSNMLVNLLFTKTVWVSTLFVVSWLFSVSLRRLKWLNVCMASVVVWNVAVIGGLVNVY